MARCKFLLSLSLLLAAPVFALDNYRATYHLSIRGVGAGTVVYEAFFTDITYRMDAVADPSVAAKMLGFGQIRETVKGLIQEGVVQPQFYQREMAGESDYNLIYDFKPKQHLINATIADSPKVMKYDHDRHPLDSLSMVVQSLLNIENKEFSTEYTLVTEDDINTYQIQKMADEKWETADSKELTVHVYYQTSGSKQTRIYFADNPLRLVKLNQIKNGESRFNLTLVKYQIIE